MRFWDYYLALETDLLACQRYVAFEPNNLGVYSLEFMHLLFSICSEVEVLCKQLCGRIEPTAKHKDIRDYKAAIEPLLCLSTFQVNDLVRREIFPPFADWKDKNSPSWWHAYNEVKHDRDIHFKQATLENCIIALGGLFVLNIYSEHKAMAEAQLSPESRLFEPEGCALSGKGSMPMNTGYLLPHAEKLSSS